MICLRGLLDAAAIDRLREAVENNLADPGPMASDYTDAGRGGRYFGDYCNWERFDGFRLVAFESELGATASRLMQSATVRLFHEHVLVKEPGTGEATPWHHDQPYYCLDGDQSVSFWVPLDPVEQAVCPRFVAGSHHSDDLYTPRLFKTGAAYDGSESRFRPVPEIDVEREGERIRAWALTPGDAIAFHFRTLHDAPPNLSAHRRRVVSFRFFGDDMRYGERPFRPSPPYPDMGLALTQGDRLPEDWFPTVWPA